MKNNNISELRKKVCSECSSNVSCIKKTDNEISQCPKLINYMRYGDTSAPICFGKKIKRID